MITSYRRILDVGCGSGMMGVGIKQKLNAEVWGVEINPEAARKAMKRLDVVFEGRIEDHFTNLPQNYFDTIVLADVLEHLLEPQEVLNALREKMSQSGELIVSIPNVRFWNVIINLLEGRWNYEDSGIMDRTHVKFFTYSSAVQLFETTGYEILNCSAVVAKNIIVPENIFDALRRSGYNVSNLREEATHFQYIFKCSPKRSTSSSLNI